MPGSGQLSETALSGDRQQVSPATVEFGKPPFSRLFGARHRNPDSFPQLIARLEGCRQTKTPSQIGSNRSKMI